MRKMWIGLVLVLVAGTTAIWVAAASARPLAKTQHVTVTAGKPSEFRFDLSKKTVKLGKVVFEVTNKGALTHDFKVCVKPATKKLATTCNGKGSRKLTPHKKIALTVVFKKKGRFEYLCTVPGHAAAGMRGVLRVT
jgi:uncharacterized cupredoxin-like copper-binding protein